MGSQKKQTICKVCSKELFTVPLLEFANMPKSAQKLPSQKELSFDSSVDLKIFQCSGCGLVQLATEPVPYYREVIRATGISSEMTQFRKEQFQKFAEKYNLSDKSILEIGTGKGEFLSIMNEFIPNCFGIEYAEESVQVCKKKNLNVSQYFFNKSTDKIENSPFDAFYILSFLEHIPNINAFLEAIKNNITEDGIGIIEVPNFDMILKNNLFSEFIADHLYYFTKETLTSTLNINGFDVLEIDEIWHNYIISATVKKREPLKLDRFKIQQEKVKFEIHEFINKFGKGKVATWGAGHQAFAILSLCKLEDKIKYIVDSAEFKQNKFSPATHIPIVSPDVLTNNTVEGIIVMAGSYSDEIVKILKHLNIDELQIAVLRDYGIEKV